MNVLSHFPSDFSIFASKVELPMYAEVPLMNFGMIIPIQMSLGFIIGKKFIMTVSLSLPSGGPVSVSLSLSRSVSQSVSVTLSLSLSVSVSLSESLTL